MLFAVENPNGGANGIIEVVMWYIMFIALIYIPFLASFDPQTRFSTFVANVTGGKKLTRTQAILAFVPVAAVLTVFYLLAFGAFVSVLEWEYGLIYDALAASPDPGDAIKRPMALGLTVATVLWGWFFLVAGMNSAIGRVRRKLGKEITPPPRKGLFG